MAEEAYMRSPALAQQPVASTSSPAAEPWKILGRDTAAGKALYRLYGGDFGGKSVGNTFHARNKAIHEAKVSAGWSPPPKEPAPPQIIKPAVNYPKFGRDKHPKEAPISYLPRRKPADQILREMEQEKERIRGERPNAKGPLLDEQEKARCAEMMRYRGKPPTLSAGERAALAAASQARRGTKKSELQELQELFAQVMQEIEERRAFLRDMESAGALKREMQQQVRNEIKTRVEDLERLDKLINAAEDAARATAGLPAYPAPSLAGALGDVGMCGGSDGVGAESDEGGEGVGGDSS